MWQCRGIYVSFLHLQTFIAAPTVKKTPGNGNGKVVFLHLLGLLGIGQPISQKMQNTVFTKKSHGPLLHLLFPYLLILLPAKLSQQPWIILPLGKDQETDWKTHLLGGSIDILKIKIESVFQSQSIFALTI